MDGASMPDLPTPISHIQHQEGEASGLIKDPGSVAKPIPGYVPFDSVSRGGDENVGQSQIPPWGDFWDPKLILPGPGANTTPSEGPHGTGNPWFNANPIVAFRTYIMEVFRVLSKAKLTDVLKGAEQLQKMLELEYQKADLILDIAKKQAQLQTIKGVMHIASIVFMAQGAWLGSRLGSKVGASRRASAGKANTSAGPSKPGTQASPAAAHAADPTDIYAQAGMNMGKAMTDATTSFIEATYTLEIGKLERRKAMLESFAKAAQRNMESAFGERGAAGLDDMMNKLIQQLTSMVTSNFQSFGNLRQ